MDKAEDSVPLSRQVLYKALPEELPWSSWKSREARHTYERIGSPSTLFFQQFYFGISCSAKYMLYFLNIHEYINMFPSRPCLTKCHLLTTTIYYSLRFSISDNISLHFWLFNIISIFYPAKEKKKPKHSSTQFRSSFR